VEKSDQINELAAALAKAQASYTAVPKQKVAKVKSQRTGAEFTYNYADLADILQMAIPCLSAQGLSFSQPHVMVDGKLRVRTLLLHSSGQWMMSDGIEISEEGDPQQFGAESTYFRRYDGCSLIGVAPDEDTDAQQAGQRVTGNQALKTQKKSVEKAEEKVEKQAAGPSQTSESSATSNGEERTTAGDDDGSQVMLDRAKELHTLADVAHGGVDKDQLQAFLRRIGYKSEVDAEGKPINSWLAISRQGLYTSVRAWILQNKKT